MLVLKRKSFEKITIDVPPSTEPRRIMVRVQGIGSDNVRLGFVADADVEILRDDAIRRDGRRVIDPACGTGTYITPPNITEVVHD